MLTITYQGRKIRLGKRMQAHLEYALKRPDAWHKIGSDKPSQLAIKRLADEGLVELWAETKLYRIKQ